MLIFSPSRRIRDNTTKHTWHNVLEVPEVVINIVDFPMVQQVSLSSCDYPKEISEFTKAGFTEEPATLVRPPMVKESKVRIECRVLDTRPLGDTPGAGNLVICEALRMHIDECILDPATGRIDQRRFPLVARLGEDWYCAVEPANLFRVEKPNSPPRDRDRCPPACYPPKQDTDRQRPRPARQCSRPPVRRPRMA